MCSLYVDDQVMNGRDNLVSELEAITWTKCNLAVINFLLSLHYKLMTH